MDTPLFELEFSRTPEEVRKMWRITQADRQSWPAVLLMLAVCAAPGMAISAYIGSRYSVFLLAVFAIAMATKIIRINRQHVTKQLVECTKPITLQAYPDFLTISSEHSESQVAYSRIDSLAELPDSLVAHIGSARMVIPRRVFPDSDEETRWKQQLDPQHATTKVTDPTVPMAALLDSPEVVTKLDRYEFSDDDVRALGKESFQFLTAKDGNQPQPKQNSRLALGAVILILLGAVTFLSLRQPGLIVIVFTFLLAIAIFIFLLNGYARYKWRSRLKSIDLPQNPEARVVLFTWGIVLGNRGYVTRRNWDQITHVGIGKSHVAIQVRPELIQLFPIRCFYSEEDATQFTQQAKDMRENYIAPAADGIVVADVVDTGNPYAAPTEDN